MRLRNYVIGGLCSAVIAAQGASTPGGNDPAVGDDGLDVVPEDNLKTMRGGVDLGNLVGYFAIDRVVQVDGQVVAKMQIVVSNLDKLSKGGMPTVSVSGPLSELVQVMNGPAGSGGGNAAAAAVAAAKTIGEPQSSGTAGLSGSSGSSGSAGSTAAGSAAAQAGTVTINVGSGTTVVPATGTASTVTSNAQGAAGSASANTGSTGSGSSGSSASSETINKVIPIGNTGQFVVVSNLPSSAGLATAIQNEVKGTLVQVQTTITAQLNGLTMLNSATLANALRSVGNLPTQSTGK